MRVSRDHALAVLFLVVIGALLFASVVPLKQTTSNRTTQFSVGAQDDLDDATMALANAYRASITKQVAAPPTGWAASQQLYFLTAPNPRQPAAP